MGYISRLLIFFGVVSMTGCLMPAQTMPAASPAPGDDAAPVDAVTAPGLLGGTSDPTVTPTLTFTPGPTLTATLKAPETTNTRPPSATAISSASSTPIPAAKTIVPMTAVPPISTFTPWPTPTPCASWVIQPTIPSARDDGIRYCVQPAVTTSAAAQYFQGGVMIWLEHPGVYFLLTKTGDVFNVRDPLTIYRDTSAQYTPPAGLYAPVSGFGYVWRGDYLADDALYASDLAKYRSDLGWVTAPEFGYQTTFQCGSYACTGCRAYDCTLSYPDGRPILLELPFNFIWPFGDWEFLE